MSAARHFALPVKEDPMQTFADEKARIAWEVGRAVSGIVAHLPPELPQLNAKSITFEADYLTRGTYAIFLSGTVIGTDRPNVFLVPERSLRVLDELRIPYRIV